MGDFAHDGWRVMGGGRAGDRFGEYGYRAVEVPGAHLLSLHDDDSVDLRLRRGTLPSAAGAAVERDFCIRVPETQQNH